MDLKLTDSEMKIMQIIWRGDEVRASHIAKAALKEIGWEKNTSYTFIYRLIDKGAIKRRDPGFYCSSVYSRNDILSGKANEVVGEMWGGSIDLFVQSFLDGNSITSDERDKLLKLIDSYDKK